MRAKLLAAAAALTLLSGAVRAQAASHLLAAVHGKVEVKKKGWTAYAPAGVGTVLRQGDFIRLTAPARATVACADLSIHEMTAGSWPVPCLDAQKTQLVWEGSLLNPTRSEASEEIPTIIAPRGTKLLSARPTLRWAPMPGITRFKVGVRGPGLNWTTDVDGATSVAYPADAPPLAPGTNYRVSVTAGGHSSDELSEAGLGFAVLDTQTANQVRAETERIRALALPADAAQLLTAHLYASHGLHAEAIDLLEGLTKAQPAPRVWQVLGTLYQAIGVNRLAEERYTQAAKESLVAGDIEGQALAQRALGVLYQDAFGLEDDAKRSLNNALALFEKLGDRNAVDEIKQRLAR